MSDFPDLDKLVERSDYDTRLAIVRWCMEKITEHAREGGSYRTLIYRRLGFGADAYGVLLDDGMTISNEFDLSLKDNVIKAYQKQDETELKKVLGLCDEPGCFKPISSGWPSESGYRTTCLEHYDGIMRNKS